ALAIPPPALFWLLAGGIAYTTGVLFFVSNRLRYAHSVWHLFVLAGTSCHFLALLGCTTGRVTCRRVSRRGPGEAPSHQHGDERCETEHQDTDKGDGLRVRVVASCAEHQPPRF